MPRAMKPSKTRHDPLHVELEQDESLRRFGRVSNPGRQHGRASKDAADEEVSFPLSWLRLADQYVGARGCADVEKDPRLGERSAERGRSRDGG